jgi:SAM-dependent methyltransferase
MNTTVSLDHAQSTPPPEDGGLGVFSSQSALANFRRPARSRIPRLRARVRRSVESRNDRGTLTVQEDWPLVAPILPCEDVALRLHQVHPGLSGYTRALSSFFDLPLGITQQRYWMGIERVGIPQAALACAEWEKAGILPDILCETGSQVYMMWSSPLFDITLTDVVNYYPPASADLRDHMPPPCSNPVEWVFRASPVHRDAPYWQRILCAILPGLYLEPYLAAPGGRELVGCDVACGWGRACLSLDNRQGHRIYACDYGQRSLDLLSQLARNSGRSEVIVPTRCDVTHLPFPSDFFDFFLAFDIFEHLPNDSLESLLCEILRCARAGAVLYAEIPLHSYCPAVTHIQDLSMESVNTMFAEAAWQGKRYSPLYYSPLVPDHFAFRVMGAPIGKR